jgi:hypothetical protein
MSVKIGLVGCGAQKKQGKHQAQDLYTSTYFELKKQYAETVCDTWYILSAKHGVILPEKQIEDYDTTVKDMTEDETREWAEQVYQDLHSWTDELASEEYEGPHRIVWLAGEDYIQPVENLVMEDDREEFVPRSQLPFRQTNGIGEQMRWLKKQIQQEKTVTQQKLGETNA